MENPAEEAIDHPNCTNLTRRRVPDNGKADDSTILAPPNRVARKLVLKCSLSPGDIVMLTAAVRDLHQCYPGQIQTDVRTLCPDLWLNNPYVTAVDDKRQDCEHIECSYPLLNRCETLPYHCLHGFVEFLNDRLGLQIRPTRYAGDIHLSRQEKLWYSQVQELTGEATPFWLLCAGGKYDATVKWWSPERFQEVVDHFKGRIAFVQVGQRGHHHPRLDGVIDLRGRTTLRELIRLVYHAQGVLCPVTCLMHLAAAVEPKPGATGVRPCVVIAGGREPVHWEAYPGHQFIHTIGALPCCARSGCWKDRVVPLGDGDERDRPARLCVNVAGKLPRCMDMISAQEVIQRIERYYEGGALRYLSDREWNAAEKGIRLTVGSTFDRLPLTRSNARVLLEQRVPTLPPYPGGFRGRGIVIAAGGCRFFTNAWVCVTRLRQLGCTLPIEVWHLGKQEMLPRMAKLLARHGVVCVDALEVRKAHPFRILGGWELKCYAIAHCGFEEVLFLDADNVAVANPERLFDTAPYQETGALFWPDLGRFDKTQLAWDLLGLKRPDGPEFESGQMLLNKRQCWRPLSLALWLNENSDFFYRFLHGDKETLRLAFERLKQSYALVQTPVLPLSGTMCQHGLDGRRLFQHRNTDKWSLFATNRKVEGFLFEDECRESLRELQQLWDSRMLLPPRLRRRRKPSRPAGGPLSIQAGMLSCPAREEMRRATLERFLQTDWGKGPEFLQLDDGEHPDPRERQQRAARQLLQRFLDGSAEFLLFLEDDLDFNRHMRHNLNHWPLLLERRIVLAGVYNPGLFEEACDLKNRAYVIRPDRVMGSQAFLLSRFAAQFMVRHWDEVDGMQDTRMSRLAGRLKQPVYYHSPSLVQHVGRTSTWGGGFHEAPDFDRDWRVAVNEPPGRKAPAVENL